MSIILRSIVEGGKTENSASSTTCIHTTKSWSQNPGAKQSAGSMTPARKRATWKTKLNPSTFTMKAAIQALVAAPVLAPIPRASSHTAPRTVAMAIAASLMARAAAVRTAMAMAVARTARAAVRTASTSENSMDRSDASNLAMEGWVGRS
jgi:hypothetical protein